MDSDQDDAGYRLGLLTGRAAALAEISAFVKRLAIAARDAADEETRLRVSAGNWFELAAWLNQGALEAVDEMTVFRRELTSLDDRS
ncbi:hypothetical protein BrevBR_08390 [Brevundimonas sp. BR2-1]|uniref:hypothetical protein n=1 Tax=Brevundimonas sp. BR2-1 TaxID=3031123 RepID=UPI0030AE21C9